MTPEPASPPRRRRWLRLSVRALLGLASAIAVALGWWSHLAHEQAAAVAAMRAAVPRVNIEYDTRSPWVPEALDRWLGADYLHRVRSVGLGEKETQLPPADRRRITAQLWHLPHLRTLCLPFPVDDEDLAPLARMSELDQFILNASNPGLTDRSLAVIGRLSRLETLMLGKTSVTDAGLAHLARMSHLRNLELGDAPVTDAGLAHLARLDRLETLFIGHTSGFSAFVEPVGAADRVGITGSGFAALGRLPRLRMLILYSPALSGPGLAGVGRLTHLEQLTLAWCGDDPSPKPVFDDLRALTPLDNLGDLQIEGFGGDATGLVQLKGIMNLVSFMAPGLGDEAIPTLLELPGLRGLTFKKHHLTAGGLAALRAKPRLQVVVDRVPGPPPAAAPP